MQEANKLKLGLFVVSSILLFIMAISVLGVFDMFSSKAQMMTMVEESVQGLSAGSAVKYRGVPIGKVTDITIQTAGKLVRVDMSVDLSKFKTESSTDHRVRNISEDQFFAYIKKDIDEGLRSRIEPDGITGMKYIEFDFQRNTLEGEEAFYMEPGYNKVTDVFYIPSVPSLFSDLRASITGLLDKLNAIDFEKISNMTVATLGAAEKLFNNPDITNSIRNIDKAAASLSQTTKSLNAALTEERMDEIVKNIDEAIHSVRTLSESLTVALEETELGETAQAVRDSLGYFNRSNRSFVEGMMKFNEGLDALIELIQYIDADPSSLLMGKSKPENRPVDR